MPANGVILLGYARSAGSGDQPVAGLVTSRRDRGTQNKQKLKKQAEQEEDRKVRQRQEVAAQFLKRKWKEEDDKRRRKAENKDKDCENESDKDDSDEEQTASMGSGQQAEPKPAEGKWVSVEDAKNKVVRPEMHLPARDAPRRDSNSGLTETERKGPLPAPAAPRQQAVSMNPVLQQKRKKALASAFGLDDDEGESRRELELAARIKRQRVDTRGPPTSVTAGTPPPAAEKRPMDMYEQLRKLAEWKRKCKGNRVPMPDDLVAAIGGTAGLQHTEPQSTLGTDGPTSASRRPVGQSRSRSRSGHGQRRFAEKQRSKSRKASRRSRSRRGAKSRSRDRRKSADETRCVL